MGRRFRLAKRRCSNGRAALDLAFSHNFIEDIRMKLIILRRCLRGLAIRGGALCRDKSKCDRIEE